MYRLDKIQQKCNFYHNTYQFILFLSRTPFDKKGKKKQKRKQQRRKKKKKKKKKIIWLILPLISHL